MSLLVLLKWNKYITILIIFCSVVLNAQNSNANYKLEETNIALIDTLDFFPLQDGNFWQFVANTIYGPEYLSFRVIGDTIMPNGNCYKYLSGWYPRSLRKDPTIVYQYYGDSIACTDREYKFLVFSMSDSSLWIICRDLGPGEGNARGVAATYYDYTYYPFFQKPLETKRFEDIYINGPDTLWTPGDGSIPMWFARGIGPVRIFIFSGGDYWLQGAVINGQQFGTLVTVENEINNIPSTFQIQAYPNPFNSTVNFNINLPESGMAEIYLFNILGEKISTIFSDYKRSGSYNIKFNADNLSSGIYLATLRQGLKNTTQKIILLK